MAEESKNPAAVELGKRGGKKTAERGPEYFAEIQARRNVRAGGRPRNPPKTIRDGVLKLCDAEIPCAVLEDGTRLLTQKGFLRALGRSPSPMGRTRRPDDDGEPLPAFLRGKALKAFISEELLAASRPILFVPSNGGLAFGYRAELLPQVCDVFLRARQGGALPPNQHHIAAKSEILVRGLAHVGIIAMVDEATGYQEMRDRKALEAILDAYLRKEFAAWAKRFPDEFYQQIFRLRGWKWKGMKVNRPQVVGHYTNDLVWDRIAPGLRTELETRNPKNERGRRSANHPQWLTEDIGHPALAQHLYALMGLQRACPAGAWKQFYEMVQRSFPKRGETVPFSFEDGEPLA